MSKEFFLIPVVLCTIGIIACVLALLSANGILEIPTPELATKFRNQKQCDACKEIDILSRKINYEILQLQRR